MNIQSIQVSQDAALAALRQYKEHRSVYDAKDWEIERIYRQIAKGKQIISVVDAIQQAGVDEKGLPRLAIARADAVEVDYHLRGTVGTFSSNQRQPRTLWKIEIPGLPSNNRWTSGEAQLPRIPPQYRPAAGTLKDYHILWEADWKSIPRDPYLLKRIGKDAWVVLAAWDLTDVEVSVLRAHAPRT
jgi:hypothetical protein